jgi:hypothetical protein
MFAHANRCGKQLTWSMLMTLSTWRLTSPCAFPRSLSACISSVILILGAFWRCVACAQGRHRHRTRGRRWPSTTTTPHTEAARRPAPLTRTMPAELLCMFACVHTCVRACIILYMCTCVRVHVCTYSVQAYVYVSFYRADYKHKI